VDIPIYENMEQVPFYTFDLISEIEDCSYFKEFEDVKDNIPEKNIFFYNKLCQKRRLSFKVIDHQSNQFFTLKTL
jgi:hypothetical protein